MSSVILKKDQEGLGKKGEMISVPFFRGKELIAAGIGAYPPQVAAKTRNGLRELDPETERLRKQNDELQAKLAEQQDRINELLATPPAPPAPGKSK